MRLELTGRHFDITPAVRRLVDDKLAKLERLLNDRAVSAQAVLTREKNRCRADITLHARGEQFLHGVGDGATLGAVDHGRRSTRSRSRRRKLKGKWEARKRARRVARAARESISRRRSPSPAQPARRARVPDAAHPARRAADDQAMSVADAARQIDATDALWSFSATRRRRRSRSSTGATAS